MSGGPGNDDINAADGTTETVNCCSGRDTARADRTDGLRSCDRVRRRPR